MSQLNNFKQEQQIEPDHADDANQTEFPVTKLCPFFCSSGQGDEQRKQGDLVA
jgi:hypothetical protein